VHIVEPCEFIIFTNAYYAGSSNTKGWKQVPNILFMSWLNHIAENSCHAKIFTVNTNFSNKPTRSDKVITNLTILRRHTHTPTHKGYVWFVTSIAILCLTFLPKVSYSIWTTNLRQSVAHLATNQTCPKKDQELTHKHSGFGGWNSLFWFFLRPGYSAESQPVSCDSLLINAEYYPNN
jgi:hypothetical protein